VFLQRNENTVLTNIAAIYSTEVKTIRNSNLKHLFVMLVQIFKQRFT